jgi:hypothetical protein
MSSHPKSDIVILVLREAEREGPAVSTTQKETRQPDIISKPARTAFAPLNLP